MSSFPGSGSIPQEMMPDEFTLPHGARWQLEGVADLGVYVAVTRPTAAARRVIAAHSLSELSAKVDAADAE